MLEARVSKCVEKRFAFPGATLAEMTIETVTSIEPWVWLTTTEVSVTEIEYFGRERTAEMISEPNGGRRFKS
jgi:hypothetical protein